MFFPATIALLGLLAADPFVGTWKLERAKSTGTLPKEELVEIQERGKMLAVTVTIVLPGADDETLRIRYSAPAAGGAGQVAEGPYNGVVLRRIDTKTMETVYLMDGKEGRSMSVVIAKDGKSMISNGRSLGSGEPVEWNMCFEKQH